MNWLVKTCVATLAIVAIGDMGFAQSATVTTTFIFKSTTASTSVTVTGVGPCSGTSSTATPGTITCTLPIAAGVEMATISVAPSGWSGSITLSGANASLFAVGGATPNYTLTAASSLAAATDTVTVTSTP